MQSWIERDILAGMSMMIARRGKVVYFETLGGLEKETERPLPEDAIFRIYSMTKPIVCAALMTLYEEGQFHLRTPVATFIPALEGLKVLVEDENGETQEVDASRPITVADMLTHTAGLTYALWEESPVNELYRQSGAIEDGTVTLEQCVEELSRLPLAFQPGTRWHYGVGVDVAARLIEVLSGQPLREFLQERIFKPLGMRDTDFYVPLEKRGRLAAMYGAGDMFAMTLPQVMAAAKQGVNERLDMRETYPADRPDTFARGGHGLFSTTYDYMRFAQMLLNNGELEGARILGRKTLELMRANHIPETLLPIKVATGPSPGVGHGFGLFVLMDPVAAKVLGTAGSYSHGGSASTGFWVDPVEELIGIFMTQYQGSHAPGADFRVLAYQAVVD